MITEAHDDQIKNNLVVFLSERYKTKRIASNFHQEYTNAETRRAEYPLNLLEIKKLAEEAESKDIAIVGIATARLTNESFDEIEAHLQKFGLPLIRHTLEQQDKGNLGEVQTKLFARIQKTLRGY